LSKNCERSHMYIVNCPKRSIPSRTVQRSLASQVGITLKAAARPSLSLAMFSCLWSEDAEPVFWRCGCSLERLSYVNIPALFCTSTTCTDVITLFPRSSGTESETDKCWPRASLEEEYGENDTETEAEAGADDHGREAAVPLTYGQYCVSQFFHVRSAIHGSESDDAIDCRKSFK
jgi:hypothetical protein